MKSKSLIKIDVTNKDYFKVVKLYSGIYPMGMVYINAKENTNEIMFECNRYKIKDLLHDMNLAIGLGVEAKMEII